MPSRDTGARKGRVCLFSSVHRAFDVRIFHKEAKTLAQQGYEVFYVVPHERDEVCDGVHILAVPPPANRFVRITRTVWQCYRRTAALNADIYQFPDPELLLVGWLLKKRGSKVIYEAQEDLPGNIPSKDWIPAFLHPIVSVVAGTVELTFASLVDCVVAATPSIGEKFRKRGIPCVDILNYPLVSEFLVDELTDCWDNREQAICYVGDLTLARGIKELIEAVVLADCRLIIAGRISSPALEKVIKTGEQTGKVEFLGYLSREDVVRRVFRRVMAGAILFHPIPNHVESLPNKIFEYMAAGLPIIASNFPLWKQLIQQEGCGICVDPFNVQEAAQAIRWIVEHPQQAREMGLRGRKAVIEKYRWDTEGKKLINLYEQLLSR